MFGPSPCVSKMFVVIVTESESLNLVHVTSYLLTQYARFLIELFIHYPNRELYTIVAKPPDVTLKKDKIHYIHYNHSNINSSLRAPFFLH